MISSLPSVQTADLAANAVTTVKIADANVTPAKLSQPLTQGTAQNSTSGTSIDFTGIPSWAKRITVVLNGVSLSGTANPRIQLGTGGTPETTGYAATCGYITSFGPAANSGSSTSGFDSVVSGAAAFALSGALVITNVSGNIWVAQGVFGNVTSTVFSIYMSGTKTLAGTLNMVRITSTNGTDTFDAGSINILYE